MQGPPARPLALAQVALQNGCSAFTRHWQGALRAFDERFRGHEHLRMNRDRVLAEETLRVVRCEGYSGASDSLISHIPVFVGRKLPGFVEVQVLWNGPMPGSRANSKAPSSTGMLEERLVFLHTQVDVFRVAAFRKKAYGRRL